MNDDILAQLNPSQQEAVKYLGGPLLILAGPGSGKTRVLTYKAVWLIKKNFSPQEILLLTFTNKAADEMKQRIFNLLNKKINHFPFAGTFHSFCVRVLRQDGEIIGIPADFIIYDEDDQKELIKQAMKEINISSENFSPFSILKAISQAKNELISALEYPQYINGDYQFTIARIYLTYERLLKKYRALDFDDLILKTVFLFENYPEVLRKYQNRFNYFLIDEYQDTNRAQYLLTKLLASKNKNLTVVGDACQAIYGFRGANYRNLLNLKEDFPNLKIINLEENYRSTKIIISAAWDLIRKNTTHPVLKLYTANPKGDLITLYQAKDQEDEAFFIVETIKNSPRSLSDFAVLYRTNAQSRVIEEAFLKAGIPYILVGGFRFYERKEIKDCIAYLRLLINPEEEVSLRRVQLLGKKRWKKFEEFRKKFIWQNYSSLEILDKILEVTNYLEKFSSQKEEDLSRLENIKELRSVAAEYPSLVEFLERVSLLSQEYLSISSNGEKKAVTLMTVHAAKGTEFPVVFLVGMEEGLFPHLKSLEDKEGIEEERRLCYVGITRAKEKVYLSFASSRFYFGRWFHSLPSRFLSDFSSEYLELIVSPYLKENIQENEKFQNSGDFF